VVFSLVVAALGSLLGSGGATSGIGMCGRFTRYYTWAEIHRLYRLTTPDSNFEPRYSICPKNDIDTVLPAFERQGLVPMRWGLVPSWWSKPLKEMKSATFNARAETVAEKPMFRDSFKRRRCLIPASGYYEWQDTPDGKQPYYFTRRDGQVMTIAGLWSDWADTTTGDNLWSCTMIITAANDFVGEVHDRMPVILEPDNFEAWLSCKAGMELLKPAANNVLQRWPVFEAGK
jgi:putative SOS response-associated peptidase YedK